MNNDPHRLLINSFLGKHRAYLKVYGEFRTLMTFYVLFLLATSTYLGITYYLDKPRPDQMLFVYSFLSIFSLVLGSGWVLVMKRRRDLQHLKAQIDMAGLIICKGNDDRGELEILDADRVPDNYLVIPQYGKINFRKYTEYFR